MPDNTQPDPGRAACGMVEMLHTRIEGLEREVARTEGLLEKVNTLARIRAHHTAELEAQLEAIGAGGVSGPLMGQPQAMPDLSALTERGAKAWAGVDAQGLRDGAASAGSEPVGWPKNAAEVREFFRSDFIRAEYVADDHRPCDEDRYYISAHDFLSAINWWADFPHHPSPPEGMVGGWTKASQQLPPCRDDQLYLGVNSAGFAGVFNAVADIAGNVHCMYETPEETLDVMSGLDLWQPFTPPTSSAYSTKGE